MRGRALLTLAAAVTVPVALTVLPGAAAATPDQGVEVLAVRSASAGDVSMVLALPAQSQPPTAVTALAGQTELPTRAEPVLSDRSAVVLVLDASAAGAAALGAGGLSGAASFLLQLPSGASTTVIADRRPPEVAAATSVGVSDDLRAVSSLRGSGDRATADALSLAVQQVPADADTHPVIVLYTTGPSADGAPATTVAERLRSAGAVLAVIDASEDDTYWSTAATSTGGVAIDAPPGRSLEAFDAVADALLQRYAVSVSGLPADAGGLRLRVDLAGGPVMVDVDLPVAAEPAAGAGAVAGQEPSRGYLWVWLVAAVFLAAVTAAALRYRRPARAADPALRPPAQATPDPPREASLFEEAVPTDAVGADGQRDQATEYQRLAARDRAEGRVALAASGYRQAVDALGRRVDLEPDNPAFRHDLAIAVTELAELDAEQGWVAQAAAGYQQAIDLGEHLVVAHPGNPDYLRSLELARSRAAALAQRGRVAD